MSVQIFTIPQKTKKSFLSFFWRIIIKISEIYKCRAPWAKRGITVFQSVLPFLVIPKMPASLVRLARM
jgi:hypothetical protein